MNSCSIDDRSGSGPLWQTPGWQALGEQSLALLAVVDSEGHCVKWHNGRLAELLGGSGAEQQFVGAQLGQLLPEAVPLLNHVAERPAAGAEPQRPCLHTSERWRMSLEPLAAGELLFQAMAVDGQELHQRKLRRQLAALRAHLDNCPLASVVWDRWMRVSYWSRSAEGLLGWSAGDVRGRTPFQWRFIYEEDRDLVKHWLQQLWSGGECSGSLCSRNYRSDGRIICCEWHCSIVRNSSGRPLSLLMLMHDTTAAEDEKRRLETADRRKDDFLATLAHELRNYICSFRNCLQLMMRRGGAALEADDAYGAAVHQVEHMGRLVEDLLDASRVARGKLALHRRWVPVEEIIQSAVETSRARIEQAGHELVLALPQESLCIFADPDRIAQAVSNLLNNSAKYTPDGGWIRLAIQAGGEDVWISVEDNGQGIPGEMLPRVFEMFTQSSGPRTREGLGIGLTLVKSLVELHGGSIEAHSQGPGQGSRFVIYLPRSVRCGEQD